MEKCKFCGKEKYILTDGKNVCLDHYFQLVDKECIRAEMDLYIDWLDEGKKLHTDTIKYLKEVKRRYPDIAEDFPRLFENL